MAYGVAPQLMKWMITQEVQKTCNYLSLSLKSHLYLPPKIQPNLLPCLELNSLFNKDDGCVVQEIWQGLFEAMYGYHVIRCMCKGFCNACTITFSDSFR